MKDLFFGLTATTLLTIMMAFAVAASGCSGAKAESSEDLEMICMYTSQGLTRCENTEAVCYKSDDGGLSCKWR